MTAETEDIDAKEFVMAQTFWLERLSKNVTGDSEAYHVFRLPGWLHTGVIANDGSNTWMAVSYVTCLRHRRPPKLFTCKYEAIDYLMP